MTGPAPSLPSALDVFVLTFNCGKAVIDVPAFATHLRGALLQRGTAARTAPSSTPGKAGAEVPGGVGYDGQEDAPALPDLVVFSLQEIAPLASGYLGGQFLAPYFNPFKEALDLAARDLLGQQQEPQPSSSSSSPSPPPPAAASATENSGRSTPRRQPLNRSRSALSNIFRRQPDFPYKLVEARNVGMTAIMLFARRPEAISRVESAECAFGIANMGNKGAVALRVSYAAEDEDRAGDLDGAADDSGREGKVAEITFVATHLAAMEYNLRRRNANWASICSSCLFEDPKKTLPEQYQFSEPGVKNTIEASIHSSSIILDAKQTDGGEDIPSETEEERDALLARRQNDASMPSEYAAHLHDISIFKPGSHLFVAGDLNYRISTTTPPALATFPTMDTYMDFLERDQLTQEKREGRTLHGLSEAPIKFPPTYKIKHLSRSKAAEAVNQQELSEAREEGREDEVVPWKWAAHRWPSWCDRILFLDIPDWVKERYMGSHGGGSSKPAPEIKIHAYSSLPTMITSDHQPVFLRASVPLLPRGELLPEMSQTAEMSSRDLEDPRFKLPVPIDTGAFARRAVARKREIYTGMTALFFSTKEGAIVMAALVGLALWSWWLYQGFF